MNRILRASILFFAGLAILVGCSEPDAASETRCPSTASFDPDRDRCVVDDESDAGESGLDASQDADTTGDSDPDTGNGTGDEPDTGSGGDSDTDNGGDDDAGNSAPDTGNGDDNPDTGNGDDDPDTGNGGDDPDTGNGDDPDTGNGDDDLDCGANLWDGNHDGTNPWEPFELDCADVMASWDCADAQAEQEILELINELRAEVHECAGVSYGPSPPLEMNAAAQCAARLHSWDMTERNYFAHDTPPEGTKFWDRMAATSFSGHSAWAENLAGATTPSGAVNGWLNSPGHCRNMLCGHYVEAGVGRMSGGATLKLGGTSLCQ